MNRTEFIGGLLDNTERGESNLNLFNQICQWIRKISWRRRYWNVSARSVPQKLLHDCSIRSEVRSNHSSLYEKTVYWFECNLIRIFRSLK